MRVVVIGAGYVGLATSVGLCLRGHAVTVVERDRQRRDALRDHTLTLSEPGISDALREVGPKLRTVAHLSDVHPNPQIVFLAVGTPSDAEGHVDLTDLRQAVRTASAQCYGALVVIRSTVPPGTTGDFANEFPELRFAHVPEFLREGHALADFLNPVRIVIGVSDGDSAALLSQLFAPFKRPILKMDTASAEITKIASNTLLASRVALINELSRVASEAGADIQRIRNAVGMDPRIGAHYLNPSLGFGGSCLPKDVAGLSAWATGRGLHLPVVDALCVSNDTHADWVLKQIPSHATNVAVWGLAFKTGTADTRNSPAIALIVKLCGRGQRVDVYDPMVPDAAPLPTGATRAESPVASLINADYLVIVNACVANSYTDPILTTLQQADAVLNLTRPPST